MHNNNSMTLEPKIDSTVGNEALAHHVVQEMIKMGITTFCLCPGSRNSPIVAVLKEYPQVEQFFLFEERSAAFFSLGRARRDKSPVAIVVTSGTAAGELLPAAMEAFYTHVPIVLLTADRPRRFSGTCAPQSAEQIGLFGIYAPFAVDVAEGEQCILDQWDLQAPAHLNIRFEDPIRKPNPLEERIVADPKHIQKEFASSYVDRFLKQVSCPLVIVSTLPSDARHAIVKFLQHLNAPVILEGLSGLREDPRLDHLRITRTDGIWKNAADSGYPIDGILRIGNVPTISLWRDLENMHGKMHVCSVSDLPYSGLSWGDIVHTPLNQFFGAFHPSRNYGSDAMHNWLRAELTFRQRFVGLLAEEPFAEASLVHSLSQKIPRRSRIYLGNSLPIREWDLAATSENRGFIISANRGLNGIDGQISTFLGLSMPEVENWAVIGDLTTLYDMPGPWVLSQLKDIAATIVVINNSGGQFFSRLYSDKAFIHPHNLGFEPFAKLWGLSYEKWTTIPSQVSGEGHRLIEIIPDNEASERFWQKLKTL